MKKKQTLLIASAAVLGTLAACGNENNEENNQMENEVEVNENTQAEEGNEEDNEENNEENTEEAADESSEDVWNIAHRGASGHAPEQTIPAYDEAVEMESDWLEMDIQMTADGELVAFHDVEVDRTTDGEGDIGEFTLEELKELDAGSWFNEEYPDQADESFEGAEIMTLEELIEEYGMEQNYYLETKDPELYDGIEEAMVEILENEGLVEEENVIIQSFSQDSLHKVQELNEDIPLVQLLWYEVDEESGEMEEWLEITPSPEEITEEDFQEIRDYAIGIGPNLEYYDGTEVIDEDFVQQALENDLHVHVYTVNEQEQMEQLIDWGVTGIFTDFPDRLNEVTE